MYQYLLPSGVYLHPMVYMDIRVYGTETTINIINRCQTTDKHMHDQSLTIAHSTCHYTGTAVL